MHRASSSVARTLRRVAFPLAALSLVVASAGAGCALKQADSEAVNGGTDTADTESNVESLSSALVSGGASTTSAITAGNSGSATTGPSLGDVSGYSPPGCATSSVDATKTHATYTFTGCTGPYGLVHVSGEVDVGVTVLDATHASVTFASQGLRVNGATIDWSASAAIAADGAKRTMAWNGHFTGTTARGRAIERTNQKTFAWTVGVPCLSVQGTSTGTVTGDELKVDVVSYARCAHECPESGSEIKVTDESKGGASYDLTYGSDTATYTGPNGGKLTFTPPCAY